MANQVNSVLGTWVRRFHWDEVVIGTEWTRGPLGLRSMWRNGYMAHSTSKDVGIRLVQSKGEQDAR